MKVKVELLAFSEEEEIREVTIPGETLDLNEVFHYGQNDFQPLPMPSLSSGDVILHDNKKILICDIGFKELSDEEYTQYKNLPRRHRTFSKFVSSLGGADL